MTVDELAGFLRQALLVLGAVFVAVDLRVGWELLAWWRRRTRALIVWPAPKPPFYAVNLAIGVMLGLLLVLTVLTVPRPASVFGLSMMFVYYGYLLPLSTRIRRGLYEDGIWTDSGFMRYVDIGGLTWAGADTLVLASRRKTLGRRLVVPGPMLGEVRHELRDTIGSHKIEFDDGPGLHLGTRDTRESA